MTVAFKSPLTSANLNGKLISRTDNQTASGKIDFINGIEINGIELTKASGVLDVSDTGGIKIPDGTDGQRPTAGNGVFRYNSTSNKFEGYENGSWTNFIGAAGARSFRAATSTDSITTGDDTVSYSGASFTATLYTAVGNAGKRVTIIHAGTSLTQVYTLATTGGQTVGGVASGSYKLITSGEVLTVESDGTNWAIVEHKTETAWLSAGAITITATTTNPTKPSGVTDDDISWRRVGSMAHIRARYRQSNNTSANNGSGDYLIALPSGIVINTSITGTFTTVEGWNSYFDLDTQDLGKFQLGATDTYIIGGISVYDTTKVRAYGAALAAGGYFASSLGFFSTASNPAWMTFDFWVPVTDWQP